MTLLPNVCPMSAMNHSPAIVSRCGGPTPQELNMCGICGAELTYIRGMWISVTDEQASAIRGPSPSPKPSHTLFDPPPQHKPDCAILAGITKMYGCTCGLLPRRQPQDTSAIPEACPLCSSADIKTGKRDGTPYLDCRSCKITIYFYARA